MKDIILKIISEIQAEKVKSKHVPTFALRIEILKRIWNKADKELTKLSDSKKVVTGRTINDEYYDLPTLNKLKTPQNKQHKQATLTL